MAFNIQIPNSTRIQHRSWRDPRFLRARREQGPEAAKTFGVRPNENNTTMYSCIQKIGNITPSLCFQSDVFYPNAIAAVSNEQERNFDQAQMVDQDNRFSSAATGCRGNQISRDFPLESRLPVAIPIVQYPTPTSELFLDQSDLCAGPVLNWEKYIETLKITLSKTKFTKGTPLKNKPPLTAPDDRRKKKTERWRQKCKDLPEECHPKLEDVSTSSSEDNDDDDDENDRVVSENTSTKSDGDIESAPPKPKKTKLQHNKNNKPIITVAEMRKSLFKSSGIGRKSISEQNAQNSLKLNQLLVQITNKKKVKEVGDKPAALAKPQLIAIKNIPKFKLQSTWNYAFGGASGSCCITTKNNSRILFTGKRTQVRQIILEKSKSSSMLSYRVKSVWDEELSKVPACIVRTGSDASDPMSNLVLQVLSPQGHFNLLGVRRGRSIDIYSIDEESPYLLDSIPNICYGARKYTGWKLKSNVVEDPLLLGLDFNPLYSAELITIDENSQVRICDINQGATVEAYNISKPTRRQTPNWFEYPNFRYINDASGVQFGHSGHLFYAWTDSTVLLGDRRCNARARAPLIEIFDLRRSTTSLSWSDQIYFNEPSIALNEYISSLKMSSKENYYYVGTTARVFLMDARVPGQPVLKFEHGTPTAAYLDTYTDSSSYEVIVSGSQRTGATLCAITDHAHVKCFDRPDCTAVNPVLHCLPTHVSNSQEFFDTTSSSSLSWEAEHQRAKAHNYAWTTGLAISKMDDHRPQNPHEPSGVSIFTSNCYGDIFYQEFEQKPVEFHRKTNVSDYKFTEFAKGWQSSMKSDSKTEFTKPSLNPFKPVDYTFLIEPSARGIQRMTNIRQEEPFDAFKPDELVHGMDKEKEIPIQNRIQQLRKSYQSDIAQRCLDFWDDDDDDEEEESITVKQERLDNEFNMRYGNEWDKDGTRDVEYLYTSNQKEATTIVDLDSQRQTTDYSIYT